MLKKKILKVADKNKNTSNEYKENKERQDKLSELLKRVAQYMVDPTIQKILLAKNKKNDQIFLSITRHPKIKHKVVRAIKEEIERREKKKQEK